MVTARYFFDCRAMTTSGQVLDIFLFWRPPRIPAPHKKTDTNLRYTFLPLGIMSYVLKKNHLRPVLRASDDLSDTVHTHHR